MAFVNLPKTACKRHNPAVPKIRDNTRQHRLNANRYKQVQKIDYSYILSINLLYLKKSGVQNPLRLLRLGGAAERKKTGKFTKWVRLQNVKATVFFKNSIDVEKNMVYSKYLHDREIHLEF